MSGTSCPGSFSVMLSPESMNMRPSGSVVAVGYQRATLMSAPRIQVPRLRVVQVRVLVPS